jgi:hypothetical protein
MSFLNRELRKKKLSTFNLDQKFRQQKAKMPSLAPPFLGVVAYRHDSCTVLMLLSRVIFATISSYRKQTQSLCMLGFVKGKGKRKKEKKAFDEEFSCKETVRKMNNQSLEKAEILSLAFCSSLLRIR